MNNKQITLATLVLNLMYEYQEKHNITKECITNAQYLFDTLKFSKVNVKVVAKYVICIGKDKVISTFPGHLVLMVYDKIIEPSFEVGQFDNRQYYDNIVDFMKDSDKILSIVNCKTMFNDKIIDSKNIKYNSLKAYLEFVNFANDINNGDILVGHKKYYNAQADYVENIMLKL